MSHDTKKITKTETIKNTYLHNHAGIGVSQLYLVWYDFIRLPPSHLSVVCFYPCVESKIMKTKAWNFLFQSVARCAFTWRIFRTKNFKTNEKNKFQGSRARQRLWRFQICPIWFCSTCDINFARRRPGGGGGRNPPLPITGPRGGGGLCRTQVTGESLVVHTTIFWQKKN